MGNQSPLSNLSRRDALKIGLKGSAYAAPVVLGVIVATPAGAVSATPTMTPVPQPQSRYRPPGQSLLHLLGRATPPWSLVLASQLVLTLLSISRVQLVGELMALVLSRLNRMGHSNSILRVYPLAR